MEIVEFGDEVVQAAEREHGRVRLALHPLNAADEVGELFQRPTLTLGEAGLVEPADHDVQRLDDPAQLAPVAGATSSTIRRSISGSLERCWLMVMNPSCWFAERSQIAHGLKVCVTSPDSGKNASMSAVSDAQALG